MVDCKLSTDTDKRTECKALTMRAYVEMIRTGKCGNDGCPFYKRRENNGKQTRL